MREAKQHTTWVQPDEVHEAAVQSFARALLTHREFLRDFEPFQRAVAAAGDRAALGQLLLKLTVPGIPDIYQGDELLCLSLVDPDNRRPVDWAARERALDALHDVLPAGADIDPARLADWCTRLEDDGLKLYLTARLLRMRREHSALMSHGTYEPIAAEGRQAEHVLSFRREYRGEARIIVVPRLTSGLEGPVPVGSAWADTVLRLPTEGAQEWRCQVGGQVVQCSQGALPLPEVLARLPVAVLAS
jgi:(1->4)-alpha-D-glucan 1-alpha-D-glucosylmutase